MTAAATCRCRFVSSAVGAIRRSEANVASVVRATILHLKHRISYGALSSVPSGLATLSVRTMMSKRTDYEDEHHLGRAMSKPKHTAEQQKKWARMMSRRERSWNVEPFELFSSAPYEVQALENIHKRSYDAKVLLEVRDVRLPASSHHPSFTRLAKHRLHLICYTHADMIDPNTRDRVEAWTLDSWPGCRCIFIDTREHRSDLPFGLLYESLIGHLESAGGKNVALTVGVANTGKSSMLMSILRYAREQQHIPKKLKATNFAGSTKKTSKRKLATIGAPLIQDKPGKTREITEYMIREKPRTFFLDVPGVSPPKFFFEDRPECWFGFVAGNLLPISKALECDPEAQTAICDYVLHCLNRDSNFLYVQKLGLDEPTDDIDKVLDKVGYTRGNESEERLHLRRCRNFLKLLNTGNLGPVILDDIRRKYDNFIFQDRHFRNNGRAGKNSRNTSGKGLPSRDRRTESPQRDENVDEDDGWSFSR